MKKISLNMANGVSKNPSVHTDFKNINLILIKNVPKESFSKKPVLPFEELAKIRFFLGKTSFGCTFCKGEMYVFKNRIKRRIF
jgi:hypothetical protein